MSLWPSIRERITALREAERGGSRARLARPSFALLVPDFFDETDDLHVAELGVALDLADKLVRDFRFTLLGSAPALASLRDGRCDEQDVARCAFALAILDSDLAWAMSASVPVRLVGSDPLGHDARKKRLSFFDMRSWYFGASPCEPSDPALAWEREEVVLLLDAFHPSSQARAIVESLTRRAPRLRVLATTRSAALRDGIGVEFPGPKAIPADAVVIATNPLLASIHQTTHTVYLVDGSGGLLRPTPESGLPPERHILYLGQEWNPIRLADRLLAPASGCVRRAAPEVRRPLVSIVVPTYDRSTDILRLAESIFAQSYPNLELVFVTNGSPPATLETLRIVRAKAARRKVAYRQIDFAAAFGCATVPRDVGSYAASGEFILYMDSDDYLGADFFEFALEKPLRRDTIYYPRRTFRNLGRKMANEIPFDVPLSSRLPAIDTGLFEMLTSKGNFLNNSGTMIAKDGFEAVGGIAHNFKYCEDYYLWLRLARMGARAEEHEGVVNIVLHPGNNELVVGDPAWIARAEAQAVEPRTP